MEVYTDDEVIYVLVTDLSHTQDTVLRGALTVNGVAYDLTTY